jgi:CheY-like chemotaxis protein
MLADEQFLRHLRYALNHLYEPDRLRQSPLAALVGVANRLDTFLALQRILTEAIESLEPAADEPSHSRTWEIYEPLFYRYVQQLSQQQVAKQLGMSVRHLRRKEHAALEVLASRLWEQFDLEAKTREDLDREMVPEQAAVGTPSVSEELAWLKSTPPESPTDLNHVLPDVMHLAEPLAVQHSVCLEVSTGDAIPSLAVHSVALSQTLLNLLSVAIHRSSGGRVYISVRPLPLELEVRIRGEKSSSSPPSVLDDDADSLDLSQQLARLCGGRLILSDCEQVFSAVLILPTLQQLLVLVIDDNADTLQLLTRYAVDTRYRLITTRDPEQALSLVEKFSPQIIVLDVMMPQVDGWKVLGRLRQHPLTAHVPIVVCTILAQEALAFALGASGFLRKPITRQTFLATLDRQAELTQTGSR